MSSRPDHEGRQSDLAVMDAQEYKQKRRLRRLLDAHDHVELVRDQAYGEYADGHISEAGKNIRILQAVQEYIREARGVLLAYSAELGEDEYNEYWRGVEGDPLGRIRMTHGEDIVFWGLRDVLHAEPLYTESWTTRRSSRHGAPTVERHSQSRSVPEAVSLAAYNRLNDFLTHERNLLGVEFESDVTPIIRHFDQSGDEPQAELGKAEYNGDPDL